MLNRSVLKDKRIILYRIKIKTRMKKKKKKGLKDRDKEDSFFLFFLRMTRKTELSCQVWLWCTYLLVKPISYLGWLQESTLLQCLDSICLYDDWFEGLIAEKKKKDYFYFIVNKVWQHLA